jgi:hypothetical protein
MRGAAILGAFALAGCVSAPQIGPCGAYGAYLRGVSARIEAGQIGPVEAKQELEKMDKLRVQCLGELGK